MYHVSCCNGYYLVGKSYDRVEALRIAQAHQDGDYDCIITQDSRIVGDMSGYHDDLSEYCPDAATQTGMYDAW